MSQQTKIRNILVTDLDGEGNVMIFTKTLTIESVKQRLDNQGRTYADIVEVPDKDRQYYVYEPTWIG